MFDPHVIAKVGEVLTLMSAPPNYRNRPLCHDLRGDFDMWFDGGAAKHDTGISTWIFTDGTMATIIVSPGAGISITLSGGRVICVSDG
jgi:hypothetical protein